MSDTPRTDAETYVWDNGGENPFVHKKFAQELERENNILRDKIQEMITGEDTIRFIDQRDRAVSICDAMMAWETPADARKTSKDLSDLKKEINEITN